MGSSISHSRYAETYKQKWNPLIATKKRVNRDFLNERIKCFVGMYDGVHYIVLLIIIICKGQPEINNVCLRCQLYMKIQKIWMKGGNTESWISYLTSH